MNSVFSLPELNGTLNELIEDTAADVDSILGQLNSLTNGQYIIQCTHFLLLTLFCLIPLFNFILPFTPLLSPRLVFLHCTSRSPHLFLSSLPFPLSHSPPTPSPRISLSPLPHPPHTSLPPSSHFPPSPTSSPPHRPLPHPPHPPLPPHRPLPTLPILPSLPSLPTLPIYATGINETSDILSDISSTSQQLRSLGAALDATLTAVSDDITQLSCPGNVPACSDVPDPNTFRSGANYSQVSTRS